MAGSEDYAGGVIESMMRMTWYLTETTVDLRQADPIDDALADLRIRGTVLLHETYPAPWAIAIPAEARLRDILGVDADTRILLFHFVRRGRFVLRMPGQESITVDAGEVAICPTGVEHRMCRGRGAQVMDIEAVLRGDAQVPTLKADVDATELVCGVFLTHAASLNPMLAALPPVMKVATGDASFSPMLAGVARMLAHEVDRRALGGFTAARVIELFCAESIRAFQRSTAAEHVGWFRGLADPRIAESLRRIHASPGDHWSVDTLAKSVALSPSRFAARFRQVMGRSVMNYVAAWRANVACRLLRESNQSLGQIAERVGYESLPAFSRAFKLQLGQAPAAWRAARLASARSASAPRGAKNGAVTQTRWMRD